jgi:Holliday junction resolvase RusA-like endonuclease
MIINTSKNVPSFKNNKLARCINNKPVLITDPKKQAIMKEITLKLSRMKKVNDYPVCVETIFHLSDKRNRDLDGMTATVMDCLVKAGILQDDSIKYVNRLEIGFIYTEKPGFEVLIKS